MTGSLDSSVPPDSTENTSSSDKIVVTPIVTEGIIRLDADEASRKAAFPSLSFADPPAREQRLGGGGSGKEELSIEELLAGVAASVEFSSRNDQQVVTIQLPDGSSFYGTGEIFTWNTDCWGFNGSTPSLYMSHPWVFSLLPDGRCIGFLADTTRRCEVDLRGAPTLCFTASAPFPLILFGPTASPLHLLQLLAKAIGPLPLPARWVLGYQQCRFSYESVARVEEVASTSRDKKITGDVMWMDIDYMEGYKSFTFDHVNCPSQPLSLFVLFLPFAPFPHLPVAKTFREKKIPCDVMWMDIDYMDGYKSFTFDPATYPDPLGLARFLNEAGFKAIWMLDPGIKKEQGYGPVESGDAADVWILNAEGKPFVGFKAIWMLDPGIKEEQGYGPVESGDAADVWILNAEGKPFLSFTFGLVSYPDPLGLAQFLNEAGFKAVWMLDPGIKEEQGYGPVESGDAADVWILNGEGKPFMGDAWLGPCKFPTRCSEQESGGETLRQGQGKEYSKPRFIPSSLRCDTALRTQGDVWPGPCKFPDYTMQRAREWWRDMVAEFAREGVDGIWNDMNEPTVFRAVNKTMPDDNIHRGDDDMGGTQNHLHYHNVYGMLMARATSEGLEKALPDKRPFVLTRAGFIGSQRYAASWTGDNLATWEYLHMSVPMALNMVWCGAVQYVRLGRCRGGSWAGSQRYAASWTGDYLATWEYLHMSVPMALNMALSSQPLNGPDIGVFALNATPRRACSLGEWASVLCCPPHHYALSGQPLNGPDIGGFALNATPRLFARWMGIGALLPFSRGHSEKGTKDAEPWVFGEAVSERNGRMERGMGMGKQITFESTQKSPERNGRMDGGMGMGKQITFESTQKSPERNGRMEGGMGMGKQIFANGTPPTQLCCGQWKIHPSNPALRAVEDQFLLGPLLVMTFTERSKFADPSAANQRLPPGTWRRFHFHDSDRDLPLLFLQRGAILFTTSRCSSCKEAPSCPRGLSLRIFRTSAAVALLSIPPSLISSSCRALSACHINYRTSRCSSCKEDLPLLFLQGGAILPTGPVAQNTQELRREDAVTLLISLDESGASEGQLFEDEGDGFGYRTREYEPHPTPPHPTPHPPHHWWDGFGQGSFSEGQLFEDEGDGFGYRAGEYLLTSYVATCGTGDGGLPVVEVKVAKEEGSWKRPWRKLVARVLLGDGAYVQAEGWDGDAISVPLPSAVETDRLVAAAVEEEKALMEAAPILPDGAKEDEEEGGGEALAATNMAAGDLQCHVVLKHGGRLDSLFHYPSGQELLESRFEEGGYEEYSESEYRSPGCQEQYHVVCEQRDHSTGGSHRMIVQGDIGSGLIMRRCFSLGQPIPAAWAAATTTANADAKSLTLSQEQQASSLSAGLDAAMVDGPTMMDGPPSVDAADDATSALPSTPNQLHVTTAIIAAAIGAGSGGFSRLACLRVHPSFRVVHSFSSAAPHVRFTSIKGTEEVVKPDVQELWLRGDDRPNGEWALVDPGTGRTVVNRFNPSQVQACFVYWGSAFCNLELVSEERPVSVETPLIVNHSYSIETVAE
ncbi:unnamed protein product [Closterium sp. NIES-64]|nr:unnamed protein product [Closterium sp. NIES-64]